ncbi:hypothetical protein F4604DRAFT_1579981 [Suillus subluteus]|nr:hypothetical protein F4604DRAFT_1579981 [Suillus subluteus]
MYHYFKFKGFYFHWPFLYAINDRPQCRYANRSARFISTYVQGLTGGEAAWANRQYHGHCTLPPSMILEVKEVLRKA